MDPAAQKDRNMLEKAPQMPIPSTEIPKKEPFLFWNTIGKQAIPRHASRTGGTRRIRRSDVAGGAERPAFTRARVQDDGSLLKTNSLKLL